MGDKYKFLLFHCIIEEFSPPKDVHIPLATQSMWICNSKGKLRLQMELRLIINWPYIIEITLYCPGGPHVLTKILTSGKATGVRKLSFHCLICPRTHSQYVSKSHTTNYFWNTPAIKGIPGLFHTLSPLIMPCCKSYTQSCAIFLAGAPAVFYKICSRFSYLQKSIKRGTVYLD